ncbi:MAG: tetratricopeptide repeat protein [Deltaproteobacteria bacterium]|nr:tetratricopeptide repeat protein [Deltaproteobacteria bacterium]
MSQKTNKPVPRTPDADFIDDDIARRLFEEAYEDQMNGFIAEARILYQRSINHYPSAPAYTYMAWLVAQEHKFEDAIELCKKAIELDPAFGNAYNDIGAYYIELEDFDNAMINLSHALKAKKHHTKAFVYFNLGKVNEHYENFANAIACYQKCLELSPGFQPATDKVEELQRGLQ